MWKSSIDDRLKKWQEFRHELNSLPLIDALTKTMNLWASSPYKTYYLDIRYPDEWPDPWQLIIQNQFCDVARCLGILYTIYFTDHCSNIQVDIRIYQDIDKCQLYSLVFINNGEYILNWSTEEIVNIKHIEEQQLQLLYQISNKDLVLEKY